MKLDVAEKMREVATDPWGNHRFRRISMFALGMVLFAAPFALIYWGVYHFTSAVDVGVGGASMVTDSKAAMTCRTMCMRIGLGDLVWDPGAWLDSILGNPLWGLIALLIPIGFFAGPLWCGWLCPGGMTEHMQRVVPSQLKIDLKERLDPAPIRYGFLAGFLLVASPFISSNISCTFCNWVMLEGLWGVPFTLLGMENTVYGDRFFQTFAFTSAQALTFILLFGALGLFMEGGRGYCNFLCPAGAVQNLAHSVGTKLPFSYKLRYFEDKCTLCRSCVEECPTWAAVEDTEERNIRYNRHVCNGCMDCVSACDEGALEYGRGESRVNN